MPISSQSNRLTSPPSAPATASGPSPNIASLAVYVLTPAAQDLLGDYLGGGGNRDAPGHFLSWLTRATTVYGYLTAGGAYDVGTPESYAEAQRAFRAMQDGSPG